MLIEHNKLETIPFEQFELNWRWNVKHNPKISDEEKSMIIPLKTEEAQKVNKIIDYFENENNLIKKYKDTDWFTVSADSKVLKEKFISKVKAETNNFDENIYITWNRKTCVYTTKKIFLNLWDDFCYPSSDDVTVISEKTNWILIYHHNEIAKIWSL
jgi:hypothetical protein